MIFVRNSTMQLRLHRQRSRPTLAVPMELRRHKALAWIFLVAYALTSAFWAKGLVLCFESDGHVSIESTTSDCSDCCSATESQESSEGSERGSGEAPTIGACACLDLALSVGNVTAAKKSPAPELQRPPLAVHQPIRWTPRGRPTYGRLNALPRSHSSSALALLSSVVLRV